MPKYVRSKRKVEDVAGGSNASSPATPNAFSTASTPSPFSMLPYTKRIAPSNPHRGTTSTNAECTADGLFLCVPSFNTSPFLSSSSKGDHSDADAAPDQGDDPWAFTPATASFLLNSNTSEMAIPTANFLEIDNPEVDRNPSKARPFVRQVQTHFLQSVPSKPSTQGRSAEARTMAAGASLVEKQEFYRNAFDAEREYWPTAVVTRERLSTELKAKKAQRAEFTPTRRSKLSVTKRTSSSAGGEHSNSATPGSSGSASPAGAATKAEIPFDGCEVHGATPTSSYLRARWMALLVNWCCIQRVSRETTQVAANILDRYYSLEHFAKSMELCQETQRTVTLACISLAAMLVEIYPPTCDQLSAYARLPEDEAIKLRDKDQRMTNVGLAPRRSFEVRRETENIKAVQEEILAKIKWKLNAPTLNFWTTAFLEELRAGGVEVSTRSPAAVLITPPSPAQSTNGADTPEPRATPGGSEDDNSGMSDEDDATKQWCSSPGRVGQPGPTPPRSNTIAGGQQLGSLWPQKTEANKLMFNERSHNFRQLLVGDMATLCMLHPRSLEFRPSILAYCLVMSTMVRPCLLLRL